MVLVHRCRRREHAGADVRNSGELEQALQRPVLAVGTVQQRKHDVDGTEVVRHLALVEDDEALRGRVAGQDECGASRVDGRQLPSGQGQRGGVVGGQNPPALGGDADGHHVETVAVDRGQHAAGRDARDRVLGAAAAEHDGHPQTPTLAHPSDSSGPDQRL